MKLTAIPGENYWRHIYLFSPEIWVGEVRLHDVLEADDVENYAITAKRHGDGSFRHDDGKPTTVCQKGDVRFVGGVRRT